MAGEIYLKHLFGKVTEKGTSNKPTKKGNEYNRSLLFEIFPKRATDYCAVSDEEIIVPAEYKGMIVMLLIAYRHDCFVDSRTGNRREERYR